MAAIERLFIPYRIPSNLAGESKAVSLPDAGSTPASGPT
jgi:hypothetical protein